MMDKIIITLILLLIVGCAQAPDYLPDSCNVVPKDVGGCKASIQLYHYDYSADACKEYYFSGCGTAPPFKTLAECHNLCVQRFGPGKELSDEDIRSALDYLRRAFNNRLDFVYEMPNPSESEVYRSIKSFKSQELGLFHGRELITKPITLPDNQNKIFVVYKDSKECQDIPVTESECAPVLDFDKKIKEQFSSKVLNEFAECEVLMKKGDCFADVALSIDDYSLCGIASSPLDHDCIEHFIQEKPEPEICNRIDDYGARANCWDGLQKAKLSIETCEAAYDLTRKNLCLQTLAFATDDSVICDKLSNEGNRAWKDECIVEFVGRGRMDIERCEDVELEHQRDWCIERGDRR